jgi:hypothetical protein
MANLTAPAPYDDGSLAIKLTVARESSRDCEPCHTPGIKTSLFGEAAMAAFAKSWRREYKEKPRGCSQGFSDQKRDV